MVKCDIYNITSYCLENAFPVLILAEEFTCIYDLVVVVGSYSGAVTTYQSWK